MILVTGAVGFIGTNFVNHWLKTYNEPILILDSLTYAGNLENLVNVIDNTQVTLKCVDICNRSKVLSILYEYQPRAVIHMAAESHVDNSIQNPDIFIYTNVKGTFELLEAVRLYWTKSNHNQNFRFLHVSTDEVFGSLKDDDLPFTENTRYAPNSPYAASKASSDHLVRAWYHTYNLPVLTTNCSNNYGPYQFPEKLIPKTIINALMGNKISVYGNGMNIRDWLFVEDHCNAIAQVLHKGHIGETYNIGGHNELNNLSIVNMICEILDELNPRDDLKSYKTLITFTEDRLGHDYRYAINSNKITKDINWAPKHPFNMNLEYTVKWYLNNMSWIFNIVSGEYQQTNNKVSR